MPLFVAEEPRGAGRSPEESARARGARTSEKPPKETPVVEDIDVDEAEPLVHIDSGKGPDEEPLDEGMIWHSVEIRDLHILNVLQ